MKDYDQYDSQSTDEDRKSWEGHIDYSKTTQNQRPRQRWVEPEEVIIDDDVDIVEVEEEKELFGGVRAPRGPKQGHYTYEDIGKQAGLSAEAVKKRASRKEFIFEDFGSVFRFIVKVINSRAKKQ